MLKINNSNIFWYEFNFLISGKMFFLYFILSLFILLIQTSEHNLSSSFFKFFIPISTNNIYF